MKILILGSQHGNEYSGEKLYSYLQNNRAELLEHVEYMTGNPQARKRRVRLVESDMNRSYSGRKNTYEERRAQKILRYIRDSGFDLVLDMHTTTVDQPPCLIMGSINTQTERFINASSVVHLIVMEEKIASTALNGVCAQSVSVEVNQDLAQVDLEKLCDDIQRYIDNEAYAVDKYVYEVTPLLKSDVTDEEFKQLRNFVRSDKGFYPVLVGESAYQKSEYNYLGFKASRRFKFKV